jgi:hypothetical protein
VKPLALSAIGSAALALLAAAALANAPAVETSWYAVRSETGAPIGYASRTVTAQPDGARTIVDAQDLYVADEEGGSSHQTGRTVRREDAAGRTIWISDDAAQAGIFIHTEAKIAGGYAEIVRRSPHDRSAWRVALAAGVRFDVGEGLLPGWDPARDPVLKFDSFDLDAGAVQRVTIEVDAAVQPASGPPAADAALTVLRRRYEDGQLMAVSRMTLDGARHIVSVTQPMFGAGVVIALSDKATATAPHPAYHALPAGMIKSPYRIPPSALDGHIRYRFGFAEGLSFPLPETGEQAVSQSSAGATVDICSACGPGLALEAASLADARRPTRWLQSDDPRIQKLAASVRGGHLSDADRMAQLTDLTVKLIPQVDFSGHFSAVETLLRGSSDCFGTAVLLAALGRAAGIPTKVADGLIYSAPRYHGVSNAFMPHSWTLAYVDGRWRSYDAGALTFDATHIAINVGDGDAAQFLAAEQLAGFLSWRGMTEVRARSAS